MNKAKCNSKLYSYVIRIVAIELYYEDVLSHVYTGIWLRTMNLLLDYKTQK